MTHNDIRQKFIGFYKKAPRLHQEIPSSPLVPENDPTTLFISAGMQPLIQNILGEPHPSGKRLVNSQKCFRAGDIDEVGDNRHSTFYEMLGNWSLGDYFKTEQLSWLFKFLTQELSLDPKRLYVTVFEGNKSVPKDTESIEIWKEIYASVGIDAKVGERIFTYPASKNWWSRAGEPEKMPAQEPGGPDSEVFYDFGPSTSSGQVRHDPRFGKHCHPNCDCGRFMEIANSVFMQYQKLADGSLKELAQKNVDFGGGLERFAAVSKNTPDIFTTDLYTSIIRRIEGLSKMTYGSSQKETRAMRIIADHIKAAVMMMADSVLPSNKLQGYILRRLIRRSLLYGRNLGLVSDWKYVGQLVEPVTLIYSDCYPEVQAKASEIKLILEEEASRFGKSLEKGLKEIEKLDKLDGFSAFKIYETFGFPWELTEEIAREKGQKVERGEFENAFKKHQEKSRSAAQGMFKGGLEDHSEQVIRLHTATHLLQQSLREILGNNVRQKGSHINSARLRFDFTHPKKLTDQEILEIEKIINLKIKENLRVTMSITVLEQALKDNVLTVPGVKYPAKVKVYSIGSFSKEVCGGPHVDFTGTLGKFKIIKEEAVSGDCRRIYAILN